MQINFCLCFHNRYTGQFVGSLLPVTQHLLFWPFSPPYPAVASDASGPTTRVGPGNGFPEGGLYRRRCLDRTELDTELCDGLCDCRRDARDYGLAAH